MKNLTNLNTALTKQAHLVPEYVTAVVALYNATGYQAKLAAREAQKIFSEHYSNDTYGGYIPISPQAKALAAIYPEDFPHYKPPTKCTPSN